MESNRIKLILIPSNAGKTSLIKPCILCKTPGFLQGPRCIGGSAIPFRC